MQYMKRVQLEQALNSMRDTDPRTAAEYAYALAVGYKQAEDFRRATHFGREAIALFDKCRMETMEECAAHNVTIEGVALPDIIHQDVVRDRLRPLEL